MTAKNRGFVEKVDSILQYYLDSKYYDHLEHFTDSGGGKYTGERWLDVLEHYTQDYDPETHLGTTFPRVESERDPDKFDSSFVLQKNIPFRGLCAHHLLPVIGHAHVSYIPRDTLVGLSKLARVVWGFSHHMPSTQEQVGEWIVEALQKYLDPLGAAVIIDAEHTCMSSRGVEEHRVITTTAALRGVFAHDPSARSELYANIQRDRT